MDKNLIVRIENQFAQRAPFSFQTRTHYLFLLYLSYIDPFAQQIRDVTISIKEIVDFLKSCAHNNPKSLSKVHWGNFKKEVEQCVKELKSKTTLLPSKHGVKKDGELVNEPVSMFSEIKATYNKEGKASYQFTVDPRMEGYLFNFARTLYVTIHPINDVLVTNKHACRLYVALKSRAESQKKYLKFPQFEVSVDELRELLELDDGAYEKSYDFKRYVIKPAIKDINSNSDLRCWYDYITKGRKLQGIRFHISVSRFNKNQLSLDLKSKGDEAYSILEKISKLHYEDIKVKQFIAFFPEEYKSIVKKVNDDWSEFFNNLQNESAQKINPDYLDSWKDGHIKTSIIEFAKRELSPNHS
jgi:plasmid replication initiation protein